MDATDRTEPRGVWVYAVTAHQPVTGLDEVTGVAGEIPRAITAAGLTAVSGDVGLAEFGEAALRRNLEDLDWLATTARAHHRVIDAVGQAPVVPMRLATVYRDDTNVATVLAERGADFRAALARTGEREEWGVKAYAARPAAPAPAGQASSGADYLQRRRRELSEREDTRRAATASAEQIHAALSRLAAGARLHPPQSPQLTGNSAPMILNAAYLLDSGRGRKFVEGVSDLAEQHPAVRLEVTGPWPPYSFATLEPAGQQVP